MNMKEFIKRPIPIHAFRWDGNLDTVRNSVPEKDLANFVWFKSPNGTELQINAREAMENVKPGDMVIKGVRGEYYPCSYPIFKQTYREVKA